MKELREVVIVDGCRTAVGNMGGALKPLHALDLAACVLQGSPWARPPRSGTTWKPGCWRNKAKKESHRMAKGTE